MTEGIPVVRMYTDDSGHTRFAKMQIPVESKTGLGSVGLFSSLFFNENIDDNSGDLKTQFALTPVPDKLEGEGPKLAHTAPRRQLVLTLSGCLEFKSCDVNTEDEEHKVVIRRGDILLADSERQKEQIWELRRKIGEAVKSNSVYKEEGSCRPRRPGLHLGTPSSL